MRNRVTLILLVSLIGLAIAPAGGAEPEKIFPYPIRSTTLDNGLSVLSVPFNSPGIVAYYTVVRAGSRNEVEKGLSGFAHFFEHMMFRGTEAYPQEKYNHVVKMLGADHNAFTTDDWTCYHLTAPASALATLIEIEADRFQNLKYSEPDFQKEARAVLGEYNKAASSPSLILNETMQDQAYTTHT
ncbi:MAG: insulinase family protein, partial [Planctomycetaceae bacterium]|nr:insulinase family protein [Planctomycetaceae bacterium]